MCWRQCAAPIEALARKERACRVASRAPLTPPLVQPLHVLFVDGRLALAERVRFERRLGVRSGISKQDEAYMDENLQITKTPKRWQGVERVRERRPGDALEQRAVGLGWLSIGLGMAQVMSPGQVARWVGAPDNERTRSAMMAVGLREVSTGVGILAQPRPTTFLWSRVLGDVMDLALLAGQWTHEKSNRTRLAAASAGVLSIAVLDAKTALDLERSRHGQDVEERGVHVKQSITVQVPPEQAYAFWRDLENLPRFMSHLEAVEVKNGQSLWRAKAPAGRSVEWTAHLIVDRPNEMLAWASDTDASVPNQGSVRFLPAPGGRGTEVHVELFYEPPLGAVGALVAKLFGEEPSLQIKGDLRRLKQVLETGDVVHSDASIHRLKHPARPPTAKEYQSFLSHEPHSITGGNS